MFTKAQRIELEALSAELFGKATHWQKIWKKEKMASDVKSMKHTKYLRTKTGQLLTVETAIAKGLISPVVEVKDKEGNVTTKPQEHEYERTSIVYRQATFEEMKKAMLTALEVKEFNNMPTVQQILAAAIKFRDGNLLNMPYLVVGENGEKDFTDLVALLPEDKKAAVMDRKVPNSNPNLLCFDGVQFVSDLVFSVNQPEEAAKLLEEYKGGTNAVMGS